VYQFSNSINNHYVCSIEPISIFTRMSLHVTWWIFYTPKNHYMDFNKNIHLKSTTAWITHRKITTLSRDKYFTHTEITTWTVIKIHAWKSLLLKNHYSFNFGMIYTTNYYQHKTAMGIALFFLWKHWY
jgi:hypothetical protein